MTKRKPPYRLCWSCNRQFHGNHHSTVETETGIVYVHKECGRELVQSGEAIEVQR